MSAGITGSSTDSVNVESISSPPSETIVDDKYPLWKYVKKLEKIGGSGGGAVKFQCNYCNKLFSGTYSRVKFHLLQQSGMGVQICRCVTNEALVEMKKLVKDCEDRVARRQVPLPTSSRWMDSISTSTKKRKGEAGSLQECWNNDARAECDAEIARMFYTSGLSFNLANNPHFRKSYILASKIPGYVPTGYNPLRTRLLQSEKKNVERELQPIKNSWHEKGVSICSDGWSDPQRRPLINVIGASQGGAMFLRAENTQGEYKDKCYIADVILKCIDDVGYQSVVQVITDNASVCRAAGLLIEAKYPHIFWTPCVVHTLNLALKSICSCSNDGSLLYDACGWVTILASDALLVKNFIMDHGMRLSMYQDHCKLKLLKVAETRFASTLIMLRRFKKIKEGLQQMVINPKWDLYKEDDVIKARCVKETILDECFWDKINDIISITDPIYDMLRRCDMDIPCLHLVYEWWDVMIEDVKKAIYRKERKQLHEKSLLFDEVYKVLIYRWTKSSTPLHCLAHSLNPKYYSIEWLSEDNARVAPHKDREISSERKKAFERYFSNQEDRRKVNIEYAEFSMTLNAFNDCDVMNDRFHMEPIVWWGIHGASAPTLQTIAFKLLGQPTSSSCCERNWSTYNFIHSLKRNKLLPRRGEDLVFIHSNLRLLSRRNPSYNEGVSRMWDIGGDAFESMEMVNVGLLEIANLTLEESSLEDSIINDDDNDVNDA